MNYGRKVFTAALAGCIAMSGYAVSAAISDVILSPENGEMVFSGKTAPNETVTYTIFKDDNESKKTYVGISEFYAEDSGRFEGSFKLNASGDFILRLNDSDGYHDTPFTYVRAEDRVAFVEGVKAAKGASDKETAAALAALFDNENNKAILQTMSYTTYNGYINLTAAEKDEFFGLFVKECSFDTLTESEFIKCFREMCGLAMLNLRGSAGLQEALDLLNPSFEETKWTNVSDEGLTAWVTEYIRMNCPYKNADAMVKEYRMLNALYKINRANGGDIVSLISKYSALLELSSDKAVRDYINSPSTGATRALLNSLSKSPAYTTQMLESAIKSASASNGNNGNNGGGGHGGGGSSLGALSVVKNDVIIDGNESSNTGNNGEMFSDIKEAEWAREAIEALASHGVISGYGDGRFAPNASVTREEFVKLVMSAFDITCNEKIYPFLDVLAADWFYPYTNAAYKSGIVTGISGSFFGVGLPITREDAAVILARTAEYKGINLSASQNRMNFTDETKISGYALEKVKTLQGAGVISGMEDGSFCPRETCTRAETAKMIYELSQRRAE